MTKDIIPTSSQTLLNKLIEAKKKQLEDYLKPMDKEKIAEILIEAETNTVILLNNIYDIFKRDLLEGLTMIDGSIRLTFVSEFRYQNKDAYSNYPYICRAEAINGCYEESPFVKIGGIFNKKLLKKLLTANGFTFSSSSDIIDINVNIKTTEINNLFDRAFTKRRFGSENYYDIDE